MTWTRGTARVIPAQLVLLAMGFMGPKQEIVKRFDLETDARSNVKADHGKFRPISPASSPRATCVVVSLSSSGRSTKDAVLRANATNT